MPRTRDIMLPIVIGIGVTVAALTLKSGINAVVRLRHLKPVEIARLNGIMLDFTTPDRNFINQNGLVNHELVRRFKQYPGGFFPKMTENEAFLILGISSDEILKLDQKMLKSKHRRCMVINHPDKGGSPYIAMKINQAKDVLENSYLLKR